MQFRHQQEQTFCVDRQGRATSFGLLAAQIDCRTAELKQLGLGSVALYFNSSRLFSVALMASLNAGLRVVILPNALPATLTDLQSEFDLLLTDQQLTTAVAHQVWQWLQALPEAAFDYQLAASASLQVFTSGSTGKPKGVSKSLANLQAELEDLSSLFAARSKNAVALSSVSHQHLYGLLFKVLWTLFYARPFVEEQLQFPEDLPEQPAVLISSPALLKRLCSPLPQEKRPKLIFSSGGALDLAAAQQCSILLGCWPFEIYGSTETGGIALRQQKTPRSLWLPLPRVRVRQHQDQQRLEILSPYCSPDRWLLTDDRVQLMPAGFELLGRVDRIVKIEEKRVSLTQVEQVLQGCLPIGAQVRVIPWQMGKRQVLAAIIAASGELRRQIDVKQLSVILAEHVESVAVPKKWQMVEYLPLNSMGKVERKSLEQLLQLGAA